MNISDESTTYALEVLGICDFGRTCESASDVVSPSCYRTGHFQYLSLGRLGWSPENIKFNEGRCDVGKRLYLEL